MVKITVLGGCGVVGSAASRLLAKDKTFDEVLIADYNLKKAKEVAEKLQEEIKGSLEKEKDAPAKKVSAVFVDANDKEEIKKAIKGSDVVLNCVGPFYKYEKNILSAVIEEGISYVDICDDTGATYEALDMDAEAKAKNITALIGMGSSPGVTNLLAAYAANDLLEKCYSIDMYHAHGGEPVEGPGVIGHRFYCLSNPVPIFIDGKEKLLSQEESKDYEEDVDFINLGTHRVYPYPHPEPITMPRFIKNKELKRVTNKGTVLPDEYYQLTRKVHEIGLSSKEPVDVNGVKVVPYDFAIAYLIREREKILKKTNFGEQKGCVKIVCKGLKKERKKLVERTYIFSLVSEGIGKNEALGEGTGYPAALGCILMQKGLIKEKGVLPPEAAINPMDFLQLMREVFAIDNTKEESRSPVIFQSIDGEGNVKTMRF
ncbi:MAG: saccharopine dehydrogenase family protein [Promethearchaeota archaeon]